MDGTLILEGVVGSTAYGLAHAGSDIDRLGILVAPTHRVLGLDGPALVSGHKATHVSRDPDRTIHEVAKYLSLALDCNPTVMELLWLLGWETNTPAGLKIIGLRRRVLWTRKVRATYGGSATQQAERLMRRCREGQAGFASDVKTAKHARHCARLLLAGRQLLTTGELVVDVARHRDYLFEVGTLAERDPAAFHAHFETERARLDTVDSVLPDVPDRARVNEVLVAIRREYS